MVDNNNGMPLGITEEIIARQPPEAQAIIRALLAEIAELRARIEELERQAKGKTPEVWIEAQRQNATLSHLSLWRDVYYTNRSGDNQPLYSATPDRPAKLNAGEYFVMGDNSTVSSDARYWRDPIDLPQEGLDVAAGRGPAQYILGRAVFVYWPAGFRPFGPASYGIIPNFGDMRWIH